MSWYSSGTLGWTLAGSTVYVIINKRLLAWWLRVTLHAGRGQTGARLGTLDVLSEPSSPGTGPSRRQVCVPEHVASASRLAGIRKESALREAPASGRGTQPVGDYVDSPTDSSGIWPLHPRPVTRTLSRASSTGRAQSLSPLIFCVSSLMILPLPMGTFVCQVGKATPRPIMLPSE